MEHSLLDWYIIGVILLLSLCTLITRCTYMLFGDKMPLSENVRRALRYAPVAALMAIIIPELVPLSTQPAEIFNLKALAAVFAVILFLRTGNGLYVIIGGMVAFWTLKFIF